MPVPRWLRYTYILLTSALEFLFVILSQWQPILYALLAVFIVPILTNCISNEISIALGQDLSVWKRLLVYIMSTLVLVIPLILRGIHQQKDKGGLSQIPTQNLKPREREPARGYKRRRSACKIDSNNTARNSNDSLTVAEMLNQAITMVYGPVHGTLAIQTELEVTRVEETGDWDFVSFGSRILHKLFEVGSQSTNDTLDEISLQIEAALRHAVELDKDCVFQFGNFAVLKYKGTFIFFM